MTTASGRFGAPGPFAFRRRNADLERRFRGKGRIVFQGVSFLEKRYRGGAFFKEADPLKRR